jgi:hypothetical protein
MGIVVACNDNPAAPAPPTFAATLNGANERPTPVSTAATGTALVVKDGGTYTYTITYTGLSGVPSMSHIHGPGNVDQAVAVLVGFPVTGATAGTGTLSGTFTAANIQRGVSSDSLDVLLRTGNAYVNVHTATNGGGEIRGQLVAR